MFNNLHKFHKKNTFDSFNVIQGTRFSYNSGYNCQFEITKGHNSTRNVGADMFFFFLFFAHRLMMVYT